MSHETTVPKCDWYLEEWCSLRLVEAMRPAASNAVPAHGNAGHAKRLPLGRLLARIPKTGPDTANLLCPVAQGPSCPYISRAPHYDRDLYELSVGGKVVRTYVRKAPNQLELLEQFENLKWPPCIVDTIRNEWDASQRMRMKETVFRLNQGQDPWLILFHCHPAQRAVSWTFHETANSNLIPIDGMEAADRVLGEDGTERPTFEADRGELRVGANLIHCFAPQAKNEILTLAAFQLQGWPRWINDPLGNPPEPGFEKHLHNTVHALNAACKWRFLRFFCDGPRRRIGWEPREKGRRSRRNRG
jgi:hypothetical protein